MSDDTALRVECALCGASLADLKASPNPTHVWRPGDWLDGTITHTLT